MKPEEIVKKQISTYLRLQYPDVIFRWDVAADISLSIGSATKSKRIHQHIKGYPDLFIAEPNTRYNGLYIEVKKDKNEVYTKKGMLRETEHIKTQIKVMTKLNRRFYFATFGLGFEHSKGIIDDYLNDI